MSRGPVVVFGGAGFLGSRIATAHVERGDRVVVVDGLLPGAGGSTENLAAIAGAIDFRPAKVEELTGLDQLLADASLVVDAMAWTRHVAAFDDPLYDLRLNLESHLHLILAARRVRGVRILYLGSRGEYGKPAETRITEAVPLVPRDVQSVHKAAADHLYRLYAERGDLSVVSLRIPNSFGPGQPVEGHDIGLVGEWIRSALAGKPITLYGTGRRRALLYSDDAAAVVCRIGDAAFKGFQAFNLAGHDVDLDDLAHAIVSIAGSGTIVREPMPEEIALMDIGNAVFDDGAIRQVLGDLPEADLQAALGTTMTYFKEKLS